MQIEWRKLLGTGSFSKINTAARPLAPGAAPRDSNFEDAVSSFVYTAHRPFHPARLHAFIAANFNLHERDWSDDLTQNAADALTTIASAADAIRVAAKMLPRHSASARRAADLASAAALAAVAEAKAAGTTVPALKPAATPAKSTAAAAAAGDGAMPYGRILRSKGMVWLAGPDRFDHVGDWSLAGDVLQFTTGGPWMARLPLSLWPTDEAKKAEIFQEFGAGRGDRCAVCPCERVLFACLIPPYVAYVSTGWSQPRICFAGSRGHSLEMKRIAAHCLSVSFSVSLSPCPSPQDQQVYCFCVCWRTCPNVRRQSTALCNAWTPRSGGGKKMGNCEQTVHHSGEAQSPCAMDHRPSAQQLHEDERECV